MTAHAEIRDEEICTPSSTASWTRRSVSEIAALVERDPEIRARIAGYRGDKARIRALYSGGLNDPLPRAWVERIEEATARRPWQRQVWTITALAASVVLVLTGIFASRQFMPAAHGDIVADALAARAETVHPDQIIPVSSTKVAAAEAGVMTHALATRVKTPDLSRMGYRLVGIDAYSAPARAFELRYADSNGRIFTLYVRRSSGAPRFDQFEEKGLRVCVWQDDVVGTVMAGTMSVAEMQRIASLAYTGMEM